jgi:NCS2 family nucleobase:cation symporter-2
MMVAGLPILLGLFACLLPAGFLLTLPRPAQYLLGSPTAFGAIAAILLNLALPRVPGRQI